LKNILQGFLLSASIGLANPVMPIFSLQKGGRLINRKKVIYPISMGGKVKG